MPTLEFDIFQRRPAGRAFSQWIAAFLIAVALGPVFQASAQSPLPTPLPTDTGSTGDTSVVPVGFTSSPPAPANASPQKTEITREVIAQELTVVEAATDLSAEIRDEIKGKLQKAAGWLDAEASSKKRQTELEAMLPQIPTLLSDAKKALAEFSDAEFQVMPNGKSISELESQLANLREQVASDEKLFRERETELESRTSRLTALAKDAVELEQKIVQLRSTSDAVNASDPAARAQMLEVRARLRLREQEVITSKLERRRVEEQGELLPLQRDLAKRTWTNRQKMLVRWQTAIDNWRKEESKRQAEAARRVAENSHSALKSLAEENALIAEKRMSAAAEIQRLSESIKRLNGLSKNLQDDFEELSDRVEHAGTTSTTGLLLRKKRSELPDDAEFAERAEFVQSTMPDVHLLLQDWKRKRREVADAEETAKAKLKSLSTSLAHVDQDEALKVLTALMNDRKELLDKAIPDQDTYLQDLNELELVNQQVGKQVADFRHYLNQRVLWIRSTDLISFGDLRDAQNGLVGILSLGRWRKTLGIGIGALMKRPAIAVGLLAVLILLAMFQARLYASQRRLSASPGDGESASFAGYLMAFGISVLLSARWPALMLGIGYRLKMTAESASWTESVGVALITSVAFLWSCELIRELCRRDGVGERLFGWPTAATSAVRTSLELTVLVGTPLFVLLQLTQFGEVDEMQSLQRVLFIAILGLIGFQISRLTRPHGPLMTCLLEENPSSPLSRGRHIVWLSASGAPLAFVMLSVIGFHFSAYQLSGHLAQTAGLLVAIIILHSLALCWLHAASHNRKLREAVDDTASSDAVVRVDSDSPVGEVVVQQVGNETAKETSGASEGDDEFRYSLRWMSALLLLFGGWFIWSEVLPALRVSDQVVLWQNIEQVPESYVNSDGNDAIRIVDHSVSTTLTDLLVAMLICVATLMVGKRLPGVLQVAFMEHLPIENGGRQAIAIIIRYVATVAGLLIACNVIRLSWSSVQWLAAAMTVGLGFGLQEIFANLVSGLIILVERPIRVGDIVSVGDVTGTVTRMQMRATTVTDYDRRELIVPNKKFITDNVINWTLSDPISRVVLPVGLAYGTDVNKVREILLRIASQCPFVLDEPGPNTLFKGFGDSTLNVQLMVFIPQRSVYIDVVNELNNAIAREFSRSGIEIAFPQLDLHVKREQLLESAIERSDARSGLNVA